MRSLRTAKRVAPAHRNYRESQREATKRKERKGGREEGREGESEKAGKQASKKEILPVKDYFFFNIFIGV